MARQPWVKVADMADGRFSNIPQSFRGTANLLHNRSLLSAQQDCHRPATARSDKSPLRGRTVIIGLIDRHSFTRECITTALSLGISKIPFTVISHSDCREVLNAETHYDVILYHPHNELAQNHEEACSSLFKALAEIAPLFVLSSGVIDWQRQLMESGCRIYMATENTTCDMMMKLIQEIKDGLCRSSSDCIPSGSEPVADSVASAQEGLTRRERDVFSLLLLGKPNKIIAHVLQMSEATARVHIRNIMRKLKARNRTEAVCRALVMELDHDIW